MNGSSEKKGITRKQFLGSVGGGALVSLLPPIAGQARAQSTLGSPIFMAKRIPDTPFTGAGEGNYHAGVECLLSLMGANGLKFYRSRSVTPLGGPEGMIWRNDVVLIKVNAQWKYRGCTNSDVIRGLIQRVLDHPDGFRGEVVIYENGQGRGSLACDTSSSYGGNTEVHANAVDESHSFLYLVENIFNDARVSAYLGDPIRGTIIGASEHSRDGYRVYENVSYPCFTTAGGRRVEVAEGIWRGTGYTQNLKLLNVPVLKDHGGSEITASLKHFYGLLSMSDGVATDRHYSDLGGTCGKMVVSIRPPVLNIIDAIWVSHRALGGYPPSNTYKSNQLLASQDPVALDYWAASRVLYPIDKNPRHHPSRPSIDSWLTAARDMINGRGGLYDPSSGILVHLVTKNPDEMTIYRASAA